MISIDVDKGRVDAMVQGSRRQPYQVAIQVKEITKTNWKKVGKALSGEARYVAMLLAGEMPQEIEEVFTGVKLSLFPERSMDLVTDCSCPDWSNPCKHIAAVYYLLGEAFDGDPFLIFKMRGMDRDGLMALLGGMAPPQAPSEAEPTMPPEPLPVDLDAFWRGKVLPDDLLGEVTTPPVDGVLLKLLGAIPFWRGEKPLQESIQPIYPRASRSGMALFLGGDVPLENGKD